MKYDLKGLFLWFLVLYFFHSHLQEVITNGTSYFNSYLKFKGFLLIITSSIYFFLYCVLAYSTFYYFFIRKKWVLFLVGLITSIILPIALRYFTQEVLFDVLFGFTNYKGDYSLGYYFRDNLYFALVYITYGVLFFFIQFYKYKDSKQQQLIIANQKLEMSLLKSQINPHFLFNSLNNIYSLVYQNSDASLDSINKLSNILKYSLYVNKDEITLREEKACLDDYIDLQRLRIDDEVIVNIKIPDQLLDSKIPQFLLFPLVENAFKHGNIKSKTHPLTLSAFRQEDDLIFNISNEVKNSSVLQGGIGLENVRKRLELMYGSDHTFAISEHDHIFIVHLKIPLS